MAKKEEKAVKENKVKKHFFKDFKAELKKVSWPTPKQLVNNTVAVVVIVVIVGAIVFALDAAFKAMNKYGITKLQSLVVEEFGEPEEESEEEHDHDHDEEENTTSDNTTTNKNTTTDGNSTESNQ